LLVKQQTMLANAMRGLATELGLGIAKGVHKPDEPEAQVQAEASASATAKLALVELHGHMRVAAARVTELEARIVSTRGTTTWRVGWRRSPAAARSPYR
jgi:error-prone DNA polymerase